MARHATPADCWVIIKDKVYDVSNWGESHPGGVVLYTHGGKDATDVFSAFHAGSTWALLRARQIGTCDDAAPELLQDFRRLRADMQTARLFESSKLYYAWKVRDHSCRCRGARPERDAASRAPQCSSNLAICAASILTLRFSDSYPALLASAFLMVRLRVRRAGRQSGSVLNARIVLLPPAGALLAAVRLAGARFPAPPGVPQPQPEQRHGAVLRQLLPGASRVDRCAATVPALT